MINKILKDIDNEESYYVGTNGCLYQDLDKEELLAIKQEIERLHSIIKEVRETLLNYGETFDLKIHQQMQKRLLEILERANNDK